jgi:hypothetical protein
MIKLANILRYSARYSLLFLGIVVFIFALISGVDDSQGMFIGIIKNFPNSLPWLGLLATVFLAWKNEFAGGTLISVLGIIMIYFFNSGPNFFLATFILTVLVTLFGIFFLLSWLIRRRVN